MQTSSCTPCCTSTPTSVNVPGADGAAGADGADGVNAYSITTTVKVTVPAIGADVTAYVDTTQWMAQGQFVVMGMDDPAAGPATFQVKSIVSTTEVLLTFKGYPSDVAAATEFPVGTTVVSAGEWGLPAPTTVYGSGTAYTLTATAAAVNLGTTDPEITLVVPGTYLLLARCRIDANTAVVNTTQRTITAKLRKTNGTPADITNATESFKTEVSASARTMTLGTIVIPPVVYTSAANTTIAMFALIDSLPGSGDINITTADIQAVRLY